MIYYVGATLFVAYAKAKAEVNEAILKESKPLSTLLLKNNYISINIGELSELSLYDYFSIGFTIVVYALRLKENAYPHAAEVKKALAPFAALENSAIYKEGWRQYSNIITMIGMFNSDIGHNLYILKHQQSSVGDGSIDTQSRADETNSFNNNFCIIAMEQALLIISASQKVFRRRKKIMGVQVAIIRLFTGGYCKKNVVAYSKGLSLVGLIYFDSET